MINTKGEWIYTNAEIAYELGLSPATINAIGKKALWKQDSSLDCS